MTHSSLVWFRNDLRLDDNPALTEAINSKLPIIPVFILETEQPKNWRQGAASCYWLHRSLNDFKKQFELIGCKLILRQGKAEDEILRLAKECDIKKVFWNRRYEPFFVKKDKIIKEKLEKKDIEVNSYKANLLYEPEEVHNKQDKPYKVFTPFWKCYQSMAEPNTLLAAPKRIHTPARYPRSESIASFNLKPRVKWYQGIDQSWQVGSQAAENQLTIFIQKRLEQYEQGRDIPSIDGISRMSPHLHFGEISPKKIWFRIRESESAQGLLTVSSSSQPYLRQIVWREFAHHLLFHFPHSSEKPWREEYRFFPWKKNKRLLMAWQRGETGYPIVDAGMRELWHTGWMHNRIRMIVASFLVKDLLIHWLEGAKWFWETLLDADLANNSMGWQWVAGSGADAAPYFRIFNPVTQSERYDPKGEYIRTWLPELKACPDSMIHKPWMAENTILKKANIILDKTYPSPIVDHTFAREEALSALKKMKDKKTKAKK